MDYMESRTYTLEEIRLFAGTFQTPAISESDVKVIATSVAQEVMLQMSGSLVSTKSCEQRREKLSRAIKVCLVVAVIGLIFGAEAMGIKTHDIIMKKIEGMQLQ